MITVSIATCTSFKGSTSALRQDCVRLIDAALGVTRRPGYSSMRTIASSTHPARRNTLGTLDAMVLIAAEGQLADDRRTAVSELIKDAIVKVHPGLRISVNLSLELKVESSIDRSPAIPIRRLEAVRARKVDEEVARLQKLRGTTAT